MSNCEIYAEKRLHQGIAGYFGGRKSRPVNYRPAFSISKKENEKARKRHAMASLLLNKGMDVVTAADYVGDDPLTIQKRYAHLINCGKIEAANVMNQILCFPQQELTRDIG